MKRNLLNSPYYLFEFFLVKLVLLILMTVFFISSYSAFMEGNLFGLLFLGLGALVAFVFDSIVMPIEESDSSIEFHHIWRQSRIARDDAEVLYLRTPAVRQRVMPFYSPAAEYADVILKDRRRKRLYLTFCDSKNGLKQTFSQWAQR